MIIGKDDDGTVVGVADSRRLVKEIPDTIHNGLGISVDVALEHLDDKPCIVINVPKGERLVDYDGRYYGRCGSTTQLFRNDELKKILLDEVGKYWLDLPCNISADKLSNEAISFFIRTGKKIGRISQSIDEADANSVLNRFNMIFDDGKISYSAALLFADNPKYIIGGSFLKIGEFDANGILLREDYIETPLIMLPERSLSVLYDKYIPATFGYDGASRVFVYKYPLEAVRELIVNAICHKDYSYHEPVTISVYPNKLEIYCMGGLPTGWTVETLKSKHQSIRRNEILAEVFHEAGFVENWAQGIDKVLRECKSNGNPEPEFSLHLNGLLATLYPKRDIRTYHEINSDKILNVKLTNTQKIILDIVRDNPTVSIVEMSKSIGVTNRTIERNLSKLLELGMICREGSKKNGRWLIKT